VAGMATAIVSLGFVFWTRTSNKIKKYTTHHNLDGIPVIVTEDVREYREIAKQCLNQQDVVLEVGCHLGVTADIISKYCREIVAIDVGELFLNKARERFPHLQFECLDGNNISAILKLGKKFNKIFVDIGGNRDLSVLLPLLRSLEAGLSPTVIVVKNYKLRRLMLQCYAYEDYREVMSENGERVKDGGLRVQECERHVGEDTKEVEEIHLEKIHREQAKEEKIQLKPEHWEQEHR